MRNLFHCSDIDDSLGARRLGREDALEDRTAGNFKQLSE